MLVLVAVIVSVGVLGYASLQFYRAVELLKIIGATEASRRVRNDALGDFFTDFREHHA